MWSPTEEERRALGPTLPPLSPCLAWQVETTRKLKDQEDKTAAAEEKLRHLRQECTEQLREKQQLMAMMKDFMVSRCSDKEMEILSADADELRQRVSDGQGVSPSRRRLSDRSLWHNQGTKNKKRGQDVCLNGCNCPHLMKGRRNDNCGQCAYRHVFEDKVRADRVVLLNGCAKGENRSEKSRRLCDLWMELRD